jgi:hypothetical protein
MCFATRQNTASLPCERSTVEDAWGRQVAAQSKAFLIKLQRAIKVNDKNTFSSFVKYPVNVFESGHRRKITTAAQLIRDYAKIMTPQMKQVILSQSPDCLFANGQGVMIGDGQIWFQKINGDDEMKITSFNLSTEAAN